MFFAHQGSGEGADEGEVEGAREIRSGAKSKVPIVIFHMFFFCFGVCGVLAVQNMEAGNLLGVFKFDTSCGAILGFKKNTMEITQNTMEMPNFGPAGGESGRPAA